MPRSLSRGRERAGARVVQRLLITLLAALAVAPTQAQNGDAAAKARFAVALARFVQWPPASEGAALRLCVLQNSPALAQAFSAHDGAGIGARRLAVVLRPGPGVAGCDLLFVDDSGWRAAAPLLADAAARPVLTLGAVDGFLARGGMVELVNVDDTLRFDVDLRAVRGAGLGLSSQALKLARHVHD